MKRYNTKELPFSRETCLNAIQSMYGVSRRQASKWLSEYTEERCRTLVEMFRDNAKKSFYQD